MLRTRTRSTGRLYVELLEDRNPPSTALDALLGGLGNPDPEPPPPPPVGRPDGSQAGRGLLDPLPIADAPVADQETARSRPDPVPTSDAPPRSTLNDDLLDPTPLLLAAPVRPVMSDTGSAPVTADAGTTRSGGADVGTAPTAPAPSPGSDGVGTESGVLAPVPGPAASGGEVDESAEVTRPSGDKPGGGIRAVARIMLTGADYIPVNANDTSDSPWRVAPNGNEMVGFPAVRDFDLAPMRDLSGWDGTGDPPAGAAMADPDLKKLTATVTNPPPAGQIAVEIIYSGTGRIRLWAEQSKVNEIVSGQNLPSYPVCDFFVEGTETSQSQNDITVRVSTVIQGITYRFDHTLTVTPYVNYFDITPKYSGQTTFARLADGKIIGLNSGEQSVNGGSLSGAAYGATFAAELTRTGVTGRGEFIHVIRDVTNGAPSGFEMDNGDRYNLLLKGGAAYPINDAPTEGVAPFYQGTDPDGLTVPVDVILNDDLHQYWAVDTPAFGINLAGRDLNRMDVTFQARMYAVWKFEDGSVYSMSRADWQVIFRASTVMGTLTIGNDSVVSAQPSVLTHQDPEAVAKPVFNTTFEVR